MRWLALLLALRGATTAEEDPLLETAEALVRRAVPGWAMVPVSVRRGDLNHRGQHATIVFANISSDEGVVVRVVGNGTASHCADAGACDAAARAAGAAGCAPRVHWAGPLPGGGRATVTARVLGDHLRAEFLRDAPADARRLGMLVRCLHRSLPFPRSGGAGGRLVAAGILEAGEGAAAGALGGFAARILGDYDDRRDRGRDTEAAFVALFGRVLRSRIGRSPLSGAAVPSHTDLHPGNLMRASPEGLVAIDFESAGTAPPSVDLAYSLLWPATHPPRATREALVSAYLGGAPATEDALWDLELGVVAALLLKVYSRLPRGANGQLGLSNAKRRDALSRGAEVAAVASAFSALEAAAPSARARRRVADIGVLAYARSRRPLVVS